MNIYVAEDKGKELFGYESDVVPRVGEFILARLEEDGVKKVVRGEVVGVDHVINSKVRCVKQDLVSVTIVLRD